VLFPVPLERVSTEMNIGNEVAKPSLTRLATILYLVTFRTNTHLRIGLFHEPVALWGVAPSESGIVLHEGRHPNS